MTRSSWIIIVATLTTAVVGAPGAHAVVTPQVRVNFNGTLTGAAYNLAPGEIDNSHSFAANGSATVAGGLGDVPGNLDPTTAGPGNVVGLGTTTGSGFFFNGALLGLGSLTAQNWISEARVRLDVPVTSQPAAFNHFLDVQGDTFYRFDGNPKVARFGYWDGSNEQTLATSALSDTAFSHVALVWNAASSDLQAYLNGVSQGTIDQNNFDDSSNPRIGYGFFARFYNRGIDGNLDAVAFSTFTGSFNAASDFQLAVPEPASVALVTLALATAPWFRRRYSAATPRRR